MYSDCLILDKGIVSNKALIETKTLIMVFFANVSPLYYSSMLLNCKWICDDLNILLLLSHIISLNIRHIQTFFVYLHNIFFFSKIESNGGIYELNEKTLKPVI